MSLVFISLIRESEAREIMKGMNFDDAHVWLRQSFVLATEPSLLNVNITDDGRFCNHSSDPNSVYASEEEPSIAVRDIESNEEITVNYSGLGSPQWYKDLCAEYKVIPTDEVARRF